MSSSIGAATRLIETGHQRAAASASTWRAYVGDLAKYVAGNALAIIFGLVTAYVALVRSGDVNPTLISVKTVDFNQYYSAARLILEGHGGSIYDFARLGAAEYAVTYPLGLAHTVLPYLYSPYFVLSVVPLAALSYNTAYIAWLVVNCALLAITLFNLERYASLPPRAALAFRLLALTCLPVFMALCLGQVSALLLALFAACFFAARAGRDTLAGVALAGAIMKPQYVAPFLLVFLIRRRWRTLLAFGTASLTLLAMPMLVLGASVNVAYLQRMLAVTHWQGRMANVSYQHMLVAPATYQAVWNHSFAGFSQLLLPAPMATMVTALLSLAALGLLARCTARSSSIEKPLVLGVLAALLISPHTLAYDLTLLLIPVAFLLRHRAENGPALAGFLVVLYLMIGVGYKLAFFVPIQISVLAMCALSVWILSGRDHPAV